MYKTLGDRRTVFLVAAISAAAPAELADALIWESASVVATITSQVGGFSYCYGMRVKPSGRIPSLRVSPLGSFVAGTPADANAPGNNIIIIAINVKKTKFTTQL